MEVTAVKIKMTGTGSLAAVEESASCLIDGRILIDCGNGLVKSLTKEGVDLYGIDSVLITHFHGDHVLDLPFLILMRSFTAVKNILTVYGPVGIEKLMREIIRLVFPDIIVEWEQIQQKAQVSYVEFEDLQTVIDDSYHIRSVEVKHGNMKGCYGYIVNDGSDTLGITGDSCLCEAVEEIVGASDLTICDMSMIQGNSAHMGTNDIEYLLGKYGKPIVATHIPGTEGGRYPL